jgi:hypothetical protein
VFINTEVTQRIIKNYLHLITMQLFTNSVLWANLPHLKVLQSCCLLLFTALVTCTSSLFTLLEQNSHCSISQYFADSLLRPSHSTTQFHSLNRLFAVFEFLCRYAPRTPSLLSDCYPLTLVFYATFCSSGSFLLSVLLHGIPCSLSVSLSRFVYEERTWPRDVRGLVGQLYNQASPLPPVTYLRC